MKKTGPTPNSWGDAQKFSICAGLRSSVNNRIEALVGRNLAAKSNQDWQLTLAMY